MTNGNLMKVESIYLSIYLSNFLIFLRVAVLHKFYCSILLDFCRDYLFCFSFIK